MGTQSNNNKKTIIKAKKAFNLTQQKKGKMYTNWQTFCEKINNKKWPTM